MPLVNPLEIRDEITPVAHLYAITRLPVFIPQDGNLVSFGEFRGFHDTVSPVGIVPVTLACDFAGFPVRKRRSSIALDIVIQHFTPFVRWGDSSTSSPPCQPLPDERGFLPTVPTLPHLGLISESTPAPEHRVIMPTLRASRFVTIGIRASHHFHDEPLSFDEDMLAHPHPLVNWGRTPSVVPSASGTRPIREGESPPVTNGCPWKGLRAFHHRGYTSCVLSTTMGWHRQDVGTTPHRSP